MSFWQETLDRLAIFKDAWGFVWRRKQWWLAPLLLVLVVAGLLVIVTEASTFGPVIYALF